jgi:hypothetical protein
MNIYLLIGAIACMAIVYLLKININNIVNRRGATSFDYFVMSLEMILSFALLLASFALILLFIKSCL